MNSILSLNQKKALRKLITKLQENHIAFQITGGLAAVFYGSGRKLYDIDLEIYQKDIEKVIKIFEKNIVVPFQHYQDEHFDLFTMTLEIDNVNIDIGQLEETYFINAKGTKIKSTANIKKAKTFEWEGLKIPIENKKELLTYKKILNRKEDQADIKAISSFCSTGENE